MITVLGGGVGKHYKKVMMKIIKKSKLRNCGGETQGGMGTKDHWERNEIRLVLAS